LRGIFKKKELKMSLIKIAQNKATSFSLKAAFTNEDGAIDLASIMVGIIVIGLIGGVIAATVFAVIPWAQDSAAKQQLDSVASAESAYIGLSTTDNTGAGQSQSFASLSGNTITGSDGSVLFDATPLNSGTTQKLAVNATGTGTSAHYGAAIRSASGKVFYITDSKTQPTNQATTGATTIDSIAAVTTVS
jgi:hypothetical protein